MQILTAQQREGMREAIKFNTEWIKIFSITSIALATGILSLGVPAFLAKSPVASDVKILLVLGSIIFFAFIFFTISLFSLNKKKINLLQK